MGMREGKLKPGSHKCVALRHVCASRLLVTASAYWYNRPSGNQRRYSQSMIDLRSGTAGAFEFEVKYDGYRLSARGESTRRFRTMRRPRKPVRPNTVTVRSFVATMIQLCQLM
jgi:hypothetical protein